MMVSMKKTLAALALMITSLPLWSANLSLPDAPLFVPGQNIPPLVMLVMGRDHTLYYEAYNDATDLDGDEKLDIYFRPIDTSDGDAIRYYGYFDSDKCYKYDTLGDEKIFIPTGVTTSGTCKTEGGGGRWSGNFLNYLTTSRIDAVRKVLYGGKRQGSSVDNPVLVRSFIPQDAHSWGKSWLPSAMNTASRGNLLISNYADLADSDSNGQLAYFFANTSLCDGTDTACPPLLRIITFNVSDITKSPTTLTAGNYTKAYNQIYFAGAPNSWGFQAMTLTAKNTWKTRVYFSDDGDTKEYKFTDKASWNGNQFGDSGQDGKAGRNDYTNIKTTAHGPVIVTFDDSTLRYSIVPDYDPIYIWNWVSKERPVSGDYIEGYGGDITSKRVDYNVKVSVCNASFLESNCRKYTNNKYQPAGFLQSYGEGESPKMLFGLLSGSYINNTQGGVLRAKVGKMDQEIDSETGLFKTRDGSAGGPGIISTLNALRITDFSYDTHQYGCGWKKTSAIANGECTSWGNPIAEMLYESIRYFAGANAATSEFSVGTGDELSLPEDSWDDPFAEENDKPYCAKPVNLVISDVGTSYDSDQVPKGKFAVYAGSLPTKISDLDVSSWTEKVSAKENVDGKLFFIGQESTDDDGKGLPTAKTITSLATIRGLSPMEPTKEGSYYSAGLAYFGHVTDVNARTGEQKPLTLSVAMASNLPQILIKAGNNDVTLIPFAKSVGGDEVSGVKDTFQPTNGIVDFYVESISETEGTFRVNFEDVEQGADHDMDMIVKYHYEVLANNQIKVTLTSEYAAGGIDQHAGYVISGTTKDGLYLDVRDKNGNSGIYYYMDTPLAVDIPYPYNSRIVSTNTSELPYERSRTFTVDTSKSAAGVLPSPLWYAAKWGSFKDNDEDKDGDGEGDANGVPDDGEWNSKDSDKPDNYFLVTNAGNLESQLKKALDSVSELVRSATSLAYTSSELTSTSQAFIASFEADKWSGDITAYPITNGVIQKTANWKASTALEAQGESDRVIFTMDSDKSKRLFTSPSVLTGSSSGLSQAQITALLTEYPVAAAATYKLPYVQTLVSYLRGDRTYEDTTKIVPGLGASLRPRNSLLGDIVHSTPVYGESVGDETPFVIFGANDGMIHVLNAETGREIFAYIPSTSYSHLSSLALTSYTHEYFVDGAIKVVDVTDGNDKKTIAVGTFGLGAKGAWALDLTNLGSVSATQNDANEHLLWELTDSSSDRIGYILNAPAVTSIANGSSTQSVAIFGNGYNAANTDGQGSLLVVDVLTGTLQKVLLNGKGLTADPLNMSRPNAVTEPVIADADLDGVGDYLYSGDLFGNVWKVEIAGKSVANWNFESEPLFVAVSKEDESQPITVRPSVAYHPEGGLLVLVGTGKYVETTDTEVTDQTTQSVYALWDKANRTSDITRDSLLEQTLENEITSTDPDQRETSKNAIDWSQHDGWYLDLYYDGNDSNLGERINSRILITNTTASFTSLIPNDEVCSGGGSGWYMEVNIYSGSNDGLVDHSAELEKIPTEPIYSYTTDENGDSVADNKVIIDGGEVHTSPSTVNKTGLSSWQMLY